MMSACNVAKTNEKRLLPLPCSQCLETAERFDPALGTWIELPNMTDRTPDNCVGVSQ